MASGFRWPRGAGTLPQVLMVCLLGTGLMLPGGCRRSSPTGPSPPVTCDWPPAASPGSLTATLDGLPLAVDRVDVAYSPANFSLSAVSDRAPACAILSILILGDVVARGPATYTAGALVPEVSAVYTLQSPRGSWRADGLNGSGSLTVTRATPASVAGTFTFQMVVDRGFPGTTATGTKVVTGTFDSAVGSALTLRPSPTRTSW